MSNLLSTDEKNSIWTENDKPEVGASGLAGSCETVVDKIPAIISRAPNYDNRGLQMSSPVQGFLKLQRAAEELFDSDIDAFLLLTQIAFRALRKNSKYNKHNLQPNQALVGDYKSIGLTEQRYRDTKERIEQKYRLATFKGTNKGTVATLLTTEVYDINSDFENEQKNEPGTNKRTNQERTENEPRTTKEECKKERMKEEKKTSSSKRSAQIFFDRSTSEFEGIDEPLMKLWKEAYPLLSMEKEFAKMKEWLLRPEHKDRTGTRAFIAKWLDRARPEETKNPRASHEKPFQSSAKTPPGNTPGSETKFYPSRVIRGGASIEESAGTPNG